MNKFFSTVKLGMSATREDLGKANDFIKKTSMAVGASALAMFGASQASAAAPATGDADIDAILTPMAGVFDIVKTAFVWLAIASISVTLVVVAFFWLRGKLKQAVQGS